MFYDDEIIKKFKFTRKQYFEKIKRLQFGVFEVLRIGGKIDMFNVNVVSFSSNGILSIEDVQEIIINYDEYYDLYYN